MDLNDRIIKRKNRSRIYQTKEHLNAVSTEEPKVQERRRRKSDLLQGKFLKRIF